MSMKIRCTFRPQAWINDQAYDVDYDGDLPRTWEVEVDELPQRNSLASDALAEHENAPEWVRGWRGPFEVDFEAVTENVQREVEEQLNRHADRCPRCRQTPQDLCHIGLRLLEATGKYIHVLPTGRGL